MPGCRLPLYRFVPTALVEMLVWAISKAMMRVPSGTSIVTAGVNPHLRDPNVSRPLAQRIETSCPPHARSPATCPAGHAGGSAGSRASSPLWPCSSISATAAVAPKLPSIWKMEPCSAGCVSNRFGPVLHQHAQRFFGHLPVAEACPKADRPCPAPACVGPPLARRRSSETRAAADSLGVRPGVMLSFD